MHRSRDRLIIIDAFSAIGTAFARHGMDIGRLDFLNYIPQREEKTPGDVKS